MMSARHRERHRTSHIGWLRAAVLGANDGIVFDGEPGAGCRGGTGHAQRGVNCGRCRLGRGRHVDGGGEYVSVHSQADTENADLERERIELQTDDKGERIELAAIYIGRGLDPALAKQVADQLMAHDALGAHARDELGITEALSARPIQAAFASAASFAVGAASPLLVAALVPQSHVIVTVSATTLAFLAVLGGLAARTGGAPLTPSMIRVTFWGALAMAITAGVGALFGTVV